MANGIVEVFNVLQETIADPNKVKDLIQIGGLITIALIVYAETGLFFCFWLPGDYLLFMAGAFCTKYLGVEIYTLMAALFTAAVFGNLTGYYFGYFVGNKLVERGDSFFFKKKYIDATRKVFDKYGGSALIIGRFLPYVRTFAPILAGMVYMQKKTFMSYNLFGAALWVSVLTLAGYFLSEAVGPEKIEEYVLYIIMGFVGFTTLTVINSIFRIRRDQKRNPEAQ